MPNAAQNIARTNQSAATDPNVSPTAAPRDQPGRARVSALAFREARASVRASQEEMTLSLPAQIEPGVPAVVVDVREAVAEAVGDAERARAAREGDERKLAAARERLRIMRSVARHGPNNFLMSCVGALLRYDQERSGEKALKMRESSFARIGNLMTDLSQRIRDGRGYDPKTSVLDAFEAYLERESARIGPAAGAAAEMVDVLRQALAAADDDLRRMAKNMAEPEPAWREIGPDEIRARVGGAIFAYARMHAMAEGEAGRPVTLEFAFGPAPGKSAFLMPELYLEVLRDLAHNSCKYAGGGTITLTVEERECDVVVGAGDEGAGIAPEELAKILRHGGSGSNSAGKQSGGQGMRSARELAEMLGGGVEEAGAGEGRGVHVKFSAKLPRA